MNHRLTVFGILALVLITSGCMSSTSSSNMTPEQTVETYVGQFTGFSEDTESSYEMLSSEVRENTEYVDYHSDIMNTKSAYTRQGYRFEVLQTEVLSESENETTVDVTFSAESTTGGTMTPSQEVTLVRQDGSWMIDEALNPYDLSQDRGDTEEQGFDDQYEPDVGPN